MFTKIGGLNNDFLQLVVEAIDRAGADPARVQRVHLHPLRLGNGCNAPVQKRA